MPFELSLKVLLSDMERHKQHLLDMINLEQSINAKDVEKLMRAYERVIRMIEFERDAEAEFGKVYLRKCAGWRLKK